MGRGPLRDYRVTQTFKNVFDGYLPVFGERTVSEKETGRRIAGGMLFSLVCLESETGATASRSHAGPRKYAPTMAPSWTWRVPGGFDGGWRVLPQGRRLLLRINVGNSE